MSQWKNVAPVLALSISAALAGTGCLAQQGADDEPSEPEVAVAQPSPEETTPPVTDEKACDEKTGDAKQAWFGSCGFPCLPGGWGIGLGGFFGGSAPFWAGWGGGCGGGCGGCGGGCGGFGGGCF